MKDSEGILQAFVTYYSRLGLPIPKYESQLLTDLLDSLQIQVLPDEAIASLDDPFTAITSFPNNKSPGPDGIPAEW